MNKLPEYSNRIVAFIDILGFTSLISTLESDTDLHSKLHRALKFIHSYKQHSQQDNTVQSDLDISVFSDSIVISSIDCNLFNVIWACGWLQAELLYLGILTRGGIAEGSTVHENDILYGEGMIKAYHIESKTAIYPRIIVDETLFKYTKANAISYFLKQDNDGLWFINQFAFDASCDGATHLAADGYDPRLIYFETVENEINQGLVKASSLTHKSKWTWLKNQFDDAYDIYKVTGETLFD
tara:strand:- start:1735 stop:2454 length:720 start_codon:yes stop_codon:yes gene_type:complete